MPIDKLPAAWGPAIEAGTAYLNCPCESCANGYRKALLAFLNKLEADGMARHGSGVVVRGGEWVADEDDPAGDAGWFPTVIIRTGGPNDPR